MKNNSRKLFSCLGFGFLGVCFVAFLNMGIFSLEVYRAKDVGAALKLLSRDHILAVQLLNHSFAFPNLSAWLMNAWRLVSLPYLVLGVSWYYTFKNRKMFKLFIAMTVVYVLMNFTYLICVGLAFSLQNLPLGFTILHSGAFVMSLVSLGSMFAVLIIFILIVSGYVDILDLTNYNNQRGDL